jgi:succinoglycan biosynthesis protein ExoL
VVFAFERKNTYPGKNKKFTIQNLGAVSHKSYLTRLFQLAKSIAKIRKAAKKADVIYTFGLDMLVLGRLAKLVSFNKKLNLVYEVGDIREILIGNSILNKIVRLIESFLLKNVELLVVTSKAFYTEYFKKIQKIKETEVQVIENKLDLDFYSGIELLGNSSPLNQMTLNIGYFGVLRCKRTFEILKLIAKKGKGSVKIYIRGVAGINNKDDLAEIKHLENIKYGGHYIVPNDLPEMYGNVDIVWACYPYQGTELGNWSWARTIRFYESCYYKKPIFVQSGTEDCKAVNKYNIGICLPLENIESTVDSILNITHEKLSEWKENVSKLPEEIYLYSSEHKELIEKLSSL